MADAGPDAVLLRARLSYSVARARSSEQTRLKNGLRAQPSLSALFNLQADFALTARRNVLFGPSGAGKSTLLRLLAGLLRPTSGTLVVRGATLTDMAAGLIVPPGKRGIGYLTQDSALFPHLSVEDNIAFGLHALDRSARRMRLPAMLELFSLQSLARRLPTHLSGGERQRVALARALAPDPALLLLDEPFSGLDVALREKTTAALEQYLAAGQTIVLAVSHDVAEVYASGADVLLLEAGRVRAPGPAAQVLAPQRELLLRRLGVNPEYCVSPWY